MQLQLVPERNRLAVVLQDLQLADAVKHVLQEYAQLRHYWLFNPSSKYLSRHLQNLVMLSIVL